MKFHSTCYYILGDKPYVLNCKNTIKYLFKYSAEKPSEEHQASDSFAAFGQWLFVMLDLIWGSAMRCYDNALDYSTEKSIKCKVMRTYSQKVILAHPGISKVLCRKKRILPTYSVSTPGFFFVRFWKISTMKKTQKIGSKKKTQPNFAPKLNALQVFLY